MHGTSRQSVVLQQSQQHCAALQAQSAQLVKTEEFHLIKRLCLQCKQQKLQNPSFEAKAHIRKNLQEVVGIERCDVIMKEMQRICKLKSISMRADSSDVTIFEGMEQLKHMNIRTINRSDIILHETGSREAAFKAAAFQFVTFTRYPIESVERVDVVEYTEDSPVRRDYEACREEFLQKGLSVVEVLVFHGTPRGHTVRNIVTDGFKVGGVDAGIPVTHGAVYGPGVYTAIGPATAQHYARGVNAVVLAKGLRGKVGSIGDVAADSVTANQDWIVFRRGCQLMPLYVVYFDPLKTGRSFSPPSIYAPTYAPAYAPAPAPNRLCHVPLTGLPGNSTAVVRPLSITGSVNSTSGVGTPAAGGTIATGSADTTVASGGESAERQRNTRSCGNRSHPIDDGQAVTGPIEGDCLDGAQSRSRKRARNGEPEAGLVTRVH